MEFTQGVHHPSGTELRQEARELLELISHTDDHQVKRALARHAHELIREAEELRLSEEAVQN
jgi:hypothetical protein